MYFQHLEVGQIVRSSLTCICKLIQVNSFSTSNVLFVDKTSRNTDQQCRLEDNYKPKVQDVSVCRTFIELHIYVKC